MCKSQSVSFQDGKVSNYEIMSKVVSMSNEKFSKSNKYDSDQNIFESRADDSHSDTYNSLDDSWKLQSSSKNKKNCSYTKELNAYIIADFFDY